MLRIATKFAPTRAAFETAVAAGFRYAELWTDAAVLDQWQAVADLADHFPLQCAIHFPNRKELGTESLERCVKLYQRLGCRAMVIHEPQFALYGEALLRLAPDICLAIENHKLSPDQWEQWWEQTDYTTLDVEHAWKFTLSNCPLPELLGELRRKLTRFSEKLRHVHLPGYLPGYDEHRPMYSAREMIFPVLSLLAEFHFRGLVVSETHQRYQTLNDLRMDVLLAETWEQTVTGSSGI